MRNLPPHRPGKIDDFAPNASLVPLHLEPTPKQIRDYLTTNPTAKIAWQL